jgi:hypothetical protein
MSDEVKHSHESLAQLACEARRRQGFEHPSPEELIAFRSGELQAASAEVLLDHLAICRDCAQLALEIPAFLLPPSAGEMHAVPDSQSSASWEAFRSRLRAEPASPPVPARAEPAGERPADAVEDPLDLLELPPSASAVAPVWLQPRTPLAMRALAACLAAGVIGLSLWIATHGHSREQSRFVALGPSEQQRSEVSANPETRLVQIRLGAEATGLIFFLPGQRPLSQPYPRFRVEFRSADGRTFSPAAAAPVTQQAVVVLLTYRQLAPGDYLARVLGVDSGREQVIQVYPLRVLAP